MGIYKTWKKGGNQEMDLSTILLDSDEISMTVPKNNINKPYSHIYHHHYHQIQGIPAGVIKEMSLIMPVRMVKGLAKTHGFIRLSTSKDLLDSSDFPLP